MVPHLVPLLLLLLPMPLVAAAEGPPVYTVSHPVSGSDLQDGSAEAKTRKLEEQGVTWTSRRGAHEAQAKGTEKCNASP